MRWGLGGGVPPPKISFFAAVERRSRSTAAKKERYSEGRRPSKPPVQTPTAQGRAHHKMYDEKMSDKVLFYAKTCRTASHGGASSDSPRWRSSTARLTTSSRL